jgi:hypothetical protein
MTDPSFKRRHSGVHSGPVARTVRIPVAHDADLQRSMVPHYEKGTSTVSLRNVDASNISLTVFEWATGRLSRAELMAEFPKWYRRTLPGRRSSQVLVLCICFCDPLSRTRCTRASRSTASRHTSILWYRWFWTRRDPIRPRWQPRRLRSCPPWDRPAVSAELSLKFECRWELWFASLIDWSSPTWERNIPRHAQQSDVVVVVEVIVGHEGARGHHRDPGPSVDAVADSDLVDDSEYHEESLRELDDAVSRG